MDALGTLNPEQKEAALHFEGPLLGLAHHAIVVAQPGGRHADELKRSLPQALFTRNVGPAGFTEGIQIVLERMEH